MADLDLMIKTGRLGQAPQVKDLPDRQIVCNLSIAVDKSYIDKGGIYQQVTQWHPLAFYNRQAEKLIATCKKGDQIHCQCSTMISKFKKRDGTQVEQTIGRVESFKNLDHLGQKTEDRINQEIEKIAERLIYAEAHPEDFKNLDVSSLLSYKSKNLSTSSQ
jgi:single stranded DNA-binding protein